ncbi:MAG: type IV pilus assembly protein PilM [Candidatus Poribacteria bacterium]|nr:type IV pilus assembly protein PilM [Candidatus Poribacteria bacterium]
MGFGRRKSVLGLDIGSHAIKLVEIKHTNKGPVITHVQSRSIPQVEDDEQDPAGATRETLHTLVDEAKLRGKRVVTAVSSALDEQVTMRSIFIPDLPLDAPEEVLQMSVRAEFEAQDYITYNDEAEIDCHIEREITLNGVRGLEVFVVAVHRDLIEGHVQLLRDCGLIPIAIDIDFLALARLLVVTQQLSPTGDTAVLDIGANQTAIGFYQPRQLYLYPHIPIAGNQLTSQLVQRLNVEWEEAEASKHAQVEEPEVWEALEDCLDQELYQQIYVHLDAYEREFPESRPAKMIVSGGTAQLPNLDQFFDSRFSIPIQIIHYLDQIAVDPKGDTAALRGNEPLFATAVGLALKQV